MKRRLIYVAHPVSGDVQGNLARAKRWIHWIHSVRGAVPIAPWITDIESGEDDSDPIARAQGLARCEYTVSRCDELWLVGGRISGGMRAELNAAARAGIAIRDFTHLGAEPPEGDAP